MLHATSAGPGRRLVLADGFTQTGATWGSAGTVLEAHHEVVRVDLPGHGGSAGERADLWESGDLVTEAGGSAMYLGYSLGARVLLHAALGHPDQVTRLVLLSGTAGIEGLTERRIRRESDEALATWIEQEGVEAFLERWLAQPLFAGLPRDAAGLEARRSNTTEGLASSLRSCGTGAMDPPLWDRLGELDMPVLVLAGERDAKFRALAERLAEGIGSSAELGIVPGAGHAAHLERPEAFLAAVLPFLDA